MGSRLCRACHKGEEVSCVVVRDGWDTGTVFRGQGLVILDKFVKLKQLECALGFDVSDGVTTVTEFGRTRIDPTHTRGLVIVKTYLRG